VDSLLCVANFPASTGYAWTFIGRMFAEVANALARDGIRTLVAYPLLDARPEALAGSAAEPLAADLSLTSPRSVWTAVEVVRREHVQAVWLVDRPVVSPAYAALHAAGVRRLVVHDHTSGTRPVPRGLRAAAKELAVRLPWAAADAVVAVSGFVAERQRTTGRVPVERLHVIPNPVSVPRAPGRPAAEVRAMLGLAAGRRMVAAAGRLTAVKGFADLLEAADALPEDVDVLVFGDGPERARLEAQRARLRTGARVRLAGERPDAAECVAAADVCVVPSRWEEAFCLAAAEPLARARPLVATHVGAIPELVRDGVNGLLVPPADPPALAAAIRRLLDAPEVAASLGQAGRAHLLSAHGWPRAVAGLVSVLAPAFGSAIGVSSGAPLPKR
jgi:glycosyltransferase involved in cell wall biosynthesis